MDRLVFIGLFALCIFAGSCGQIFLKKAANKGYEGWHVFVNKYTAVGYSITFMVTVAISLLYGFLGISEGALIESLTYIFVPTLSFIFFKERLNRRTFIGIAFILTGVAVFALWEQIEGLLF